MTLRYEGVRFSDGSIAVRRIASDPCDRATTTFEGMRELEEDIGSADVTWIADRCGSQPPAPQNSDSESIRPAIGSGPNPQSDVAPVVEKQGPASASTLGAIRRHDEFAHPIRPAYLGDDYPRIAARYEPTEETDEP